MTAPVEGFLRVTLNTMHARITRAGEIYPRVMAVLSPWARSPIMWAIPPMPEYCVVPEAMTATESKTAAWYPAGGQAVTHGCRKGTV